MKGLKYCFVLLLIISSQFSFSQQIFINEFMSSNGSSIKDEDGNNEDWIELFNASESSVNLEGFYISDRQNNPKKWAFPNIEIAAKEYLVIFASNKNRRNPDGRLHTNFAISASGEDLVLSNEAGILQIIPAIAVPRDKSYGFQRDGQEPLVIFDVPTPGARNSGGSTPLVGSILFSKSGGIYDFLGEKLEIFTPDTQYFIRYTIDGSVPKHNSLFYEGSISLDSSTLSPSFISREEISLPDYFNPPAKENVKKAIVIRAALFDEYERRVSDIFTQSYFLQNLGNYSENIPIISLAVDPNSLLNFNTGIFVKGANYNPHVDWWTGNFQMRGSEWERDASLEFYEFDTIGFKQNIGIRTHGGLTRNYDQRGLRFYARAQYGATSFNYEIFKNYPQTNFERLVAKPFRSSFTPAGTQDFITDMMANKLGLDASQSRLVNLYINGEYWGIYYLKERVDDKFLAYKHNIDENDITIIEHWDGVVNTGDDKDFLDLISFLEINELDVDENYQWIKSKIDINNFINYQLFQIYISNVDWPNNNMKMWKTSRPLSKWKWIYFDGDAALTGYNYDAFSAAMGVPVEYARTSERSGLLFSKLMKNNQFKSAFFTRLEELMSSDYLNIIGMEYHAEIGKLIEPSISDQMLRFQIPKDLNSWIDSKNQIANFFRKRPCEIKRLLKEVYNYDLIANIFCENEPTVELDKYVLYPNPNKGNFEFVVEAYDSTKTALSLCNYLGQYVDKNLFEVSNKGNFVKIISQNLTPGVYFLVLSEKNQKQVMKFVVER
jgi:hypothetical protein